MIRDVDPSQWRRAGELFHEFVTLDPAERSARLASLSTDPVLRRAVEALLAGDAVAEAHLPAAGFGLVAASAIAADPLHLIGQTVSHFRIEEHLASGGMGVVYRAEDVPLRRPVALKFLLPSHQLTPSAQERFLDEARSAGALDHPNLCPVYEIGESAAGLFLAMPLYRGETLKDRLARTGPLAGQEALTIAEQVAAGLHCAHEAGIVHRDIKPGNIMLLPDGTVKILDFGLAKFQADASISRGLLGTVGYMAPEQIRRGGVDARTDLWALGVMLYEMVSGVRPFTGEHEAAVLHAILHERPRPLAARGHDLRSGLEPLILTLLQKDPDARYPDARALTEAIAAIRGGGEAVVPPRRRSIRRLTLAAGAGLLVLLAGAYVWFGSGPSLLSRGMIAEQDRLVIADFTVAGLDTLLGPWLANALGRYLDQSRTVSVMSRGEVTSALQRMRRPSGTRLDLELTRELAQREGVRAVVEGNVAPLGAGYLVMVRLVAAATGDELAAFYATARRPEMLMSALGTVGRSFRRGIGESLRVVRADPPLPWYTTSSIEALRLMAALPPWSRESGGSIPVLRAIVALDSTFAYAWFVMGNRLPAESAARDSAVTMAYRFRDRLTPSEHAQATVAYLLWVERDRRRVIATYENALARDSQQVLAITSLGTILNTVREFERAEALLRPHQSVADPATFHMAIALLGQGKFAAAESALARSPGNQPGLVIEARARLAIAALRYDTAAAIGEPTSVSAVARVRGRLAEARRLDSSADSSAAKSRRIAEIASDPAFARPVREANEALWLLQEPALALTPLDSAFAARPANTLRETRDQIDAVRAAALYAAAGRPAVARTILETVAANSDRLALRAIHPFQYAARGEIALAEGRPAEAMGYFRDSDLAADGLPATPCAVCILPGLARAAERAGWADSARIFWERYVTTSAVNRHQTDQWFLAMAYERLGALYADAGDHVKAGEYRARLAELWKNADPELRRRR